MAANTYGQPAMTAIIDVKGGKKQYSTAAGWNGSDFLLDPYTYEYLNATMQRNRDDPVRMWMYFIPVHIYTTPNACHADSHQYNYSLPPT